MHTIETAAAGCERAANLPRPESVTYVPTTHSSGPVTRVVELATTDPQREILRLVLRGEVQAPVEADPAVLYFGRIARGSRPVRRRRWDVGVVRWSTAGGADVLNVRVRL